MSRFRRLLRRRGTWIGGALRRRRTPSGALSPNDWRHVAGAFPQVDRARLSGSRVLAAREAASQYHAHMALHSEERGPLPSYSKPPVVEVAVGVHFLPVPGLNVVELVTMHGIWDEQFPKIQQQPVLPPVSGPGSDPILSFQFSPMAQPVRIWMLTDDDSYLVQVQNDRLILNWRKTSETGEQYPRYSTVRKVFLEVWKRFTGFVEERRLGVVQPSFVEVTFFNRIDLISGESLATYLATLNSEWHVSAQRSSAYQTEVDLLDSYGTVIGSQTINASQNSSEGHFCQLEIVSRVGSQQSSTEFILNGLDRAHDFGVHSFDASTTAYAHQRWGRE